MFFREWWREAQQNRYVILKKGKVGLRKMKIDELNVHFHKILEGHVMKSLEKNQWSWRAWTAACQASLSFTISRSLLKLMSIESVMPSNHLILCCPLVLLPSIFPSIRVFSNKSAFCIKWPKYWNFSFAGFFLLERKRVQRAPITWEDQSETQRK